MQENFIAWKRIYSMKETIFIRAKRMYVQIIISMYHEIQSSLQVSFFEKKKKIIS